MLPPAYLGSDVDEYAQSNRRDELLDGPSKLVLRFNAAVRCKDKQHALEIVPLLLCEANQVVIKVVVVEPYRVSHMIDDRVFRFAECLESFVKLKGSDFTIEKRLDQFGERRSGRSRRDCIAC